MDSRLDFETARLPGCQFLRNVKEPSNEFESGLFICSLEHLQWHIAEKRSLLKVSKIYLNGLT